MRKNQFTEQRKREIFEKNLPNVAAFIPEQVKTTIQDKIAFIPKRLRTSFLQDTIMCVVHNCLIGMSNKETAIYLGHSNYNEIHRVADKVVFNAKNGKSNISKRKYMYSMVPSIAANIVSQYFELNEGSASFGSACASGLTAVVNAYYRLNNDLDSALIIGADMNQEGIHVLSGINALNALYSGKDYEKAPIPFSAARTGFVAGEGAAGILFVSEAYLKKNDFTPLFKVVGVGQSTCQALAERKSIYAGTKFQAVAIQRALKLANVNPEQINLIVCHGTGTLVGDSTEAETLRIVFGNNIPPMTGLQGNLGHSFGASGPMNMCIASEIFKRGVIPPIRTYDIDEEFSDLDLIRKSREFSREYILCYSFGFGGANVSVVLKKC